MGKALLIVLILVLTATAADARRRGHRHYGGHGFYPMEMAPAWQRPVPAKRYSIQRPVPAERYTTIQRPLPEERYTTGQSPGRVGLSQMVPPDWQLQPPDPNWHGRRFLSPDGQSWLAAYSSPADRGALAAHLKEVAFVEGEEITYLQGERSWIAVSGFKGDRIFYRKVVLACAGKTWRQIALEYPAQAKRAVDGLVSRVSRALEPDANDENCRSELSSQ